LIPSIVLDRLQKARADARGGRNFLKGYAAHFAFPPQMFAERCRRHRTKKNIGVGQGGVNAARQMTSRAGPLALRQSRPNARCSERKRFTIMHTLHRESQDASQQSSVERTRRATDAQPFEGVERRHNPSAIVEVPEGNEVTLFHELGKALTSSLQLDQVLRTIMEKINEVLRPDTWSLLLMDPDKRELYF